MEDRVSSRSPFGDKIREAYLESAEFFAGLVDGVDIDGWEEHALGQWTVRDLAGHTYRSISTVVGYSEKPAPQVDVESPVAWILNVRQNADPDRVAEMGRSAGLEIMDSPTMMVRGFLSMARDRVNDLDDDFILATPQGGMRFIDYLQLRTMELVIHGGDLAKALGVEAKPPDSGTQVALQVLTGVAVAEGRGPSLADALTGRSLLPANFNLLI
jgi:uncharacterized protein (TIGR03083 family)